MNCLLCNSTSRLLYTKVNPERGQLHYFMCGGDCALIFLDPEQRLEAGDERARYDLHNNDDGDEGYRSFLSRLADAVRERIASDVHGLDFGCGPAPVMADLFGEKGIAMDSYDPFYFDDTELLAKKYGVITSSEVFEHVYDPRATVEQLVGMLGPGGVLGVMTEMSTGPDDFADWWYHSDPTHVCFYSKQTFEWIARWQRLHVAFPRKNVVVFSI